MVAIKPESGRWHRGVKQPNEIKLAALRALIEREPGLTKTELCIRTGIGRSTLPYYLRHVREELAHATAKNEKLRLQAAEKDVDLALMVTSLAVRMGREVDSLLERSGNDLASKSVAARLAVAFDRLTRLSADMSGNMPSVNVQFNQFQTIALASLNPSLLSAEAQAVHGVTSDDSTNSR